jgi:hypothetical protein
LPVKWESSTTPALADGRLYVRFLGKLACYDLVKRQCDRRQTNEEPMVNNGWGTLVLTVNALASTRQEEGIITSVDREYRNFKASAFEYYGHTSDGADARALVLRLRK